jgi:hypothetical protein
VATDILKTFPDLAAIGESQLQSYCDEWAKRPVAKQFAVTHITVDAALMLHIYLASENVVELGDQAVLPIDELLGYIIDRHFQDADKRKKLHAAVREARNMETVGRIWLKCKNQACGAELETHHFASPGQEIVCPPTKVTCPGCGVTSEYEGGDLFVRAGS